MVRNYVRKTDRATKYTHDDLLEAVIKVKSGELSAYRASIAYNIPRPTIVARVNGRYGEKSDSLGRLTVIPKEIEAKMAENLHYMEIYGFGLSRTEIMELIGHYVTKNNIKNPFKNGIPGEDWFLAFKKRHNLSVKKPQAVENSRKKACSPWIIYPYFDLLKKTMDELDLHDKPSHIWNLDETSFCKDPSKTKVVGLKGYASTRTIASPGKSNTTILLEISAAGDKTPPLIVFKGKDIWDKWTSKDDYPGTCYAATKNGWMETDVFENFFKKVFLPTVGQKRPILLIYDGHSTHVGLNIIAKAREANITILKLPAHTSDNLQPLDLAVNKSFKDKWDQALVKWQRLHVGEVLPKEDFSKLIGQIWAQVDPKVCVAGFRKAGIFPFNNNAVPEEKFHPDQLAEYKKQLCQSNKPQSTQPTASPSWPKDIAKNESNIPTMSNTSIGVPSPFPSLISICLNKVNDHYKKCFSVNEKHLTDAQTVGTTQPVDSNANKIIVLDDRLVNCYFTFEELLLQKISSRSQHHKQKRTKVAGGAEVITSEEVFNKQKYIEEEKKKKNQKKEERMKKRLEKTSEKDIKSSKQKNKTTENTMIEGDGKKAVKVKLEDKKIRNSNKKNIRIVKKNTSAPSKKKKKYCSSTSESDADLELMDESDLENLEEMLIDEEKDLDNIGEMLYCEKNNENVNNLDDYDDPTTSTVVQGQKNKTTENTMIEGDGKKAAKVKLEDKKIRNSNKKNTRIVKKKTSAPSKKKKKYCSSTSESDADLELMDESDLENLEEMLIDEEKDLDNIGEMLYGEKNNENVNNLDDYDDPATSTIVQGQWVLVKFTTKTSIKHFVGIVSSVNEEGIPTVKYVRKSACRDMEDSTAFVFPDVPDVCELRHLEDIQCKLPNPIIGRRGKIFFKISFHGYNIK